MLKKFSVTNFKNFASKTILELDKPANYEFNREIIVNNIVTKGIIYGINGCGKSNLALALFDIVLHLTDKQKALDKYSLYCNLDSSKPTADFEYIFEFSGIEVTYRYRKQSPLLLVEESLIIDGEEVLNYDYSTHKGYTTLKGAENLQLTSEMIPEQDSLSRVKYIKNNALLKDDLVNRAFIDFIGFVNNMLMFYSLDENKYQGFLVGADSYTQGIVREGKIRDFETFLREQGIDIKLYEVSINGVADLYCGFKNATVPFGSVVSTGTKSLALFYYWFIKMSKASFVFVDEYDAFYHFELSQKLVELVKKLSNTQVFFSTHNTDLLSNELLRPDAFYLIKDNKIKSFDKITEKELRKAHNIQKMFKAGTFNE